MTNTSAIPIIIIIGMVAVMAISRWFYVSTSLSWNPGRYCREGALRLLSKVKNVSRLAVEQIPNNRLPTESFENCLTPSS